MGNLLSGQRLYRLALLGLVALLAFSLWNQQKLESRIKTLELGLYAPDQAGVYLEAPESQEEYFGRNSAINPALRGYTNPKTVRVTLPVWRERIDERVTVLEHKLRDAATGREVSSSKCPQHHSGRLLTSKCERWPLW